MRDRTPYPPSGNCDRAYCCPIRMMSLSHDLWQANQDLANACLIHPFVQGIAAGTLPKHLFADYVGQDAFFLTAFARAYSISAAKTANLTDFELFHTLASGVLQELHLHRGYAASWGVDLSQTAPSAATQRYTDFLLATAWSQDIGLTAVAMAPCMRLYVFLGQTLAQNGTPAHLYSDWIRTYSSPAFEHLAHQLEQFIDGQPLTGTVSHSTYRYAMLCERDFFQSAWEGAK